MILCVDCGLTAGKVLLFSNDGYCVAQTRFVTPLSHACIDTRALREVLTDAIQTLITHAPCAPNEITCVSVSGHGNGLYAITDDGVLPVGYSSMTAESAAFVPAQQDVLARTMQSGWAGQPLAILAWLKATQPSCYQKIRFILFCKDLLRWFMTGVVATEPTDASAGGLLNLHTAQYDRVLLSIYHLEDAFDKLPPLLRSDAVAGRITQAFAMQTGLPAGTPVLAGLFDVNSCMLGAGVIDDTRLSMTAGTWGINAIASKTAVGSADITQCCLFYGALRYVCIDSAPTSCINLEWFLRNILPETGYEEANRIVRAQKTDDTLLYFPYLYAPMDHPNAPCGFVGLQPYHDRAAMLRALYEGIVFEHRRRMEKLQQLGRCPDTIVLSGGAASSPVFAQLFSDICQKDVLIPAQKQAGAMGGVLLCQMAVRSYPGLPSAVASLVHYIDRYQPSQEHAAQYARAYSRFCSYLDFCAQHTLKRS